MGPEVYRFYYNTTKKQEYLNEKVEKLMYFLQFFPFFVFRL